MNMEMKWKRERLPANTGSLFGYIRDGYFLFVSLVKDEK